MQNVAGSAKMMRTDAYDQLKARLFAGELRTGQFVSQRELTDLLGATLNPVREAVRKLEAEGLINVYAQRGIQIIESDPKAVNDAFDYRLLLELNAVRHFATSATTEQIQALVDDVEKSIDSLVRFPDDRKVRMKALDNDYKFHKHLIDFQNNEIVSKHYSMNAARLRLFRINIGEPLQRLDVAAREHLEILEACKARDPDNAAARLSRHIGISREHTLGLRPVRWSVNPA
jgi:DNA-binding GntR family transcriptional regulator